MQNELRIGRVYRHFKGDFYLVEAVANDSETGEPFVAVSYTHLTLPTIA